MNGACIWAYLALPPGAQGRSQKVRYQFQLQSQFQKFLYQTLCVFPQIKDTGFSFRPLGGDLRVLGGAWGFKI